MLVLWECPCEAAGAAGHASDPSESLPEADLTFIGRMARAQDEKAYPNLDTLLFYLF